MRGFAGFYHYGHPCFIREEYEAAHIGEDELQRLEDALGMSFSDMNTAMYYALMHARYLLYRCESDEIDNELLKGKDCWMPFKCGYVHIVTGEYVPSSIKPDFDSYPCWKIEEPYGSYFNPNSVIQLSGGVSLFALACGLLALLIGGNNK